MFNPYFVMYVHVTCYSRKFHAVYILGIAIPDSPWALDDLNQQNGRRRGRR